METPVPVPAGSTQAPLTREEAARLYDLMDAAMAMLGWDAEPDGDDDMRVQLSFYQGKRLHQLLDEVHTTLLVTSWPGPTGPAAAGL